VEAKLQGRKETCLHIEADETRQDNPAIFPEEIERMPRALCPGDDSKVERSQSERGKQADPGRQAPLTRCPMFGIRDTSRDLQCFHAACRTGAPGACLALTCGKRPRRLARRLLFVFLQGVPPGCV
jgi:hypothetical protein